MASRHHPPNCFDNRASHDSEQRLSPALAAELQR
jgi:hypothetical protein